MFKLRELRRLGMPGLARFAATGLISAACVTHYKPPADNPAHALGRAGHAPPPGLTNVSQTVLPLKPGPEDG